MVGAGGARCAAAAVVVEVVVIVVVVYMEFIFSAPASIRSGPGREEAGAEMATEPPRVGAVGLRRPSGLLRAGDRKVAGSIPGSSSS